MGPGPMGPNKGPWAQGPWVMGPWAHGLMGPWAHGLMGPWAHGLMDSWAHGPMGPWTHGPMGPRAHGLMGLGPRAGATPWGPGPSVSQETLRENGARKKRPSGLRKKSFLETFLETMAMLHPIKGTKPNRSYRCVKAR